MNTLPLIAMMLLAADTGPRTTVIVVTGAPGSEEYGTMFAAWAGRWQNAAEQAGAEVIRIGDGTDDSNNDREILQQQLQQIDQEKTSAVWLILIGHGTFDGRQAKFNLRGPDVAAAELTQWLEPLETPLAIVNCASSSGPFINCLSGRKRVVLTATKSGHEHNFARFGDYISSAIADEAADLDKDEQTSLLEAFLSASSGVDEFYQDDARLATEHALLDDNGDGLGTPADWFRGFRAVRSAKEGASPDGRQANQLFLVRRPAEANMPAEFRQRREELEAQVEELREQKELMEEDDYFRRLESLFIEIAKLHGDFEQSTDATH